MNRTRRHPYMTPEQSLIYDEVHTVFLNILVGRDKILQSYEVSGNYKFLFTLGKKASFVALGEVKWERAIDAIVRSLERTFTNHLLYMWDEQERANFINDAYTFIREVDKLKSQRPAVLDNLSPPFRIKLETPTSEDSGSED